MVLGLPRRPVQDSSALLKHKKKQRLSKAAMLTNCVQGEDRELSSKTTTKVILNFFFR